MYIISFFSDLGKKNIIYNIDITIILIQFSEYCFISRFYLLTSSCTAIFKLQIRRNLHSKFIDRIKTSYIIVNVAAHKPILSIPDNPLLLAGIFYGSSSSSWVGFVLLRDRISAPIIERYLHCRMH